MRGFAAVFSIVYTCVAGIALLFVVAPALLVALLFLTIGLAFPLLYLPSVAIYLTALWPAALVAGASPRRVISALALGCACLLGTARLPGLLAERAAARDAALVLREDVTGRLDAPPRAIAIERPAAAYAGPDDPLLTAPCDALCQTLLLGREADAVRVSVIAGARAPAHVAYAYEERRACPSAFRSALTALPATRRAVAEGRCIVATDGGAWAPGPKLVETRLDDPWTASPFLHDGRGRVRLEVLVPEAAGWRMVARATELRTGLLRAPLMLGFATIRGTEIEPRWERAERVIHPTDATTVARASLGYRAEPLPDPEPEPPLATIERILSRPGDAAIGPELAAPIDAYLSGLGKKPALSGDDIDLMRRLIADRRVSDHLQVFFVLRRSPNAAAAMIPDLIDRLAEPMSAASGDNHNRLAQIVSRAPPPSLAPHAGRLLALARSADDQRLAPLLRVAGRLGVDPTALIRLKLASPAKAVREAAAFAVCHADEPWGRALAPDLRAVLDLHRGRRYDGDRDLVAALKGLRRWGLEGEAEAFRAGQPEPNASWLRAAIDRREATGGDADC